MAVSEHSALILVVDDDEGLLTLMADALVADRYEIATAASARAAREWLKAHTPDLMILDLKLRDGSGPALVAELQRDMAPVPFVVVTGQGDEKVAVEVMKQGALDYVMKDTALLDLLPTIVRRALAVATQAKALAEAQAEQKRLEREIVAVGERERMSIGADLHDGLGQQLTALELMCTALKEDFASRPDLEKRLDLMCKILREAIAQTRFLARGLVPVGHDRDSLQVGLAELANRMSAAGRLECTFESPEAIEVSDSFVTGHLYRIAQEAVSNAVKHARASHVIIRLSRTPQLLQLEIIDDGTGMTKSKSTRRGLGLGLMQHRAATIGAELSVTSKRGEGVAVICRLPQKD